jgi:hypothetical protein
MFIYRSFQLPRTLEMKHLKWVALPLVAAVSMTAFSSAFAQSENHRVYSAFVRSDGNVIGGDDWIDLVTVTNSTHFTIAVKPDIPRLVCVASPFAQVLPPTKIPLINTSTLGPNHTLGIDSMLYNSITGETGAISFNIICTPRDER